MVAQNLLRVSFVVTLAVLWLLYFAMNHVDYITFSDNIHKKYADRKPKPVLAFLRTLSPNTDLQMKSKFSNGSNTLQPQDDTTKPVINNYIQVLQNVNVSASGKLRVLIGVESSIDVKGKARRKVIRETWGRKTDGVSVVFVVGVNNTHRHYTQSVLDLQKESSINHDILIGDFLDTYRNLTTKTLFLLQWMSTYGKTIDFLLKTDDDIFINVETLLRFLDTVPSKKVLVGSVNKNSKVQRSTQSKWHVSKSSYSKAEYPPYAAGIGYIMSWDVVRDIYNEARFVPLWSVEDAFFTGVMAEKIGLTPVNCNRFGKYTEMRRKPCDVHRSIATHMRRETQMNKMWEMAQMIKASECKDTLLVKQVTAAR